MGVPLNLPQRDGSRLAAPVPAHCGRRDGGALANLGTEMHSAKGKDVHDVYVPSQQLTWNLTGSLSKRKIVFQDPLLSGFMLLGGRVTSP